MSDQHRYIAICDEEEDYACRLMEYLLRAEGKAWEVQAFLGADSLLEHADPSSCVLLIAAESAWRDPRLRQAPFSRVLVLNESGQYLPEAPQSVSKYQSMDLLLGQLRALLGEALQEPGGTAGIRHGEPLSVIGFYSPVTRALKSTFALTMGELLAAQGKKVLFLDPDPCSALPALLGVEMEGSIGDLLYYNDCAREKFPGALAGLAVPLSGVDLLPGADSFSALHAVRGEQWLSLIESVQQQTDYAALLLDLSAAVSGLEDILRRCGRVYTLTRPDSISSARVRAYERILQRGGYEDVLVHTQMVELPAFSRLPADLRYLTGGDLAAFVRELMRKERDGEESV